MKTLLAALLLVSVSLLTPPVWIEKALTPWLPQAWGNFAGQPLTEQEAYELALRLVPGLTQVDFAVVITSGPNPNAFFAWDAGMFSEKVQAVIVMTGLKEFPRQTQLLIFLHELAHANQWLNVGFESELKQTEWEADVQGVKWACQLGIDSRWAAYFWVWLYQEHGYEGDSNHPMAYERISLENTCPADRG